MSQYMFWLIILFCLTPSIFAILAIVASCIVSGRDAQPSKAPAEHHDLEKLPTRSIHIYEPPSEMTIVVKRQSM